MTVDFDDESDARPWIDGVCDAARILGGALMVIGSYAPWTHQSLNGPGFTFYRNGMQLGNARSFSFAGVIAIVFGARAILHGALGLAGRRLPRLVAGASLLDGLVGVGVGLFAVGAATWYIGQMLQGTYSSLFLAGASYGIWTVLGGGSLVLVAEIVGGLSRVHPRVRVMVAIGSVVMIGVVAFFLAPK